MKNGESRYVRASAPWMRGKLNSVNGIRQIQAALKLLADIGLVKRVKISQQSMKGNPNPVRTWFYQVLYDLVDPEMEERFLTEQLKKDLTNDPQGSTTITHLQEENSKERLTIDSLMNEGLDTPSEQLTSQIEQTETWIGNQHLNQDQHSASVETNIKPKPILKQDQVKQPSKLNQVLDAVEQFGINRKQVARAVKKHLKWADYALRALKWQLENGELRNPTGYFLSVLFKQTKIQEQIAPEVEAPKMSQEEFVEFVAQVALKQQAQPEEAEPEELKSAEPESEPELEIKQQPELKAQPQVRLQPQAKSEPQPEAKPDPRQQFFDTLDEIITEQPVEASRPALNDLKSMFPQDWCGLAQKYGYSAEEIQAEQPRQRPPLEQLKQLYPDCWREAAVRFGYELNGS